MNKPIGGKTMRILSDINFSLNDLTKKVFLYGNKRSSLYGRHDNKFYEGGIAGKKHFI